MKYIIGGIIAFILFISGVIVGGKYYAKTEIKVIEKEVTKTEYKYKDLKADSKPVFDVDNFNRLLQCYDSPLQFEHRVEKNSLFVKAFDDCKEAEAKFGIGTKNNIRMYLTVGAIGVGVGILAYALIKD